MVGLGTLSKNAAGGRLRIAVRAQKQKLSAKTQKRAKQYAAHGAGGAGTVSGLSSSLAFTPVQVRRLHLAPGYRNPTPQNYFAEYCIDWVEAAEVRTCASAEVYLMGLLLFGCRSCVFPGPANTTVSTCTAGHRAAQPQCCRCRRRHEVRHRVLLLGVLRCAPLQAYALHLHMRLRSTAVLVRCVSCR